ncbi:MAG: hypothetical protein DRP82_02200 [Planctomycetota bacterium]|nr:MAG: hypothetical protein DRP82_02200 [Planctomycetota bacterium]
MIHKSVRHAAVAPRTEKGLEELRLFSREALKDAALNDYDRGLVLLCIDEVLTAVIENAKRFASDDEQLQLVIDIDEVRVRIMIEDSETRFDNRVDEQTFGSIRDDDARREIDVLFLTSVMDEVTYNYQKGLQNVLVMTKFLPTAD